MTPKVESKRRHRPNGIAPAHSFKGELLSGSLEQERLNTPVLDSLPAPCAPNADRALFGSEPVGHIGDQRTFILKRIQVTKDSELLITDKSSPHAAHELMLMGAATKPIPGIFDIGERFSVATGEAMRRFAYYCNQRNLHPVIGWSYDPHTTGRKSFQAVKTFHAHLIARTDVEIAYVRNHARPLSELEPIRRRRIADETSSIATIVVGDLVPALASSALRYLQPGKTATSATSVAFRLGRGWDSLEDPGFWKELKIVVDFLNDVYTLGVKALFERIPTAHRGGHQWESGILRNNTDNHLCEMKARFSSETSDFLDHFIRSLYPEVLSTLGRSEYVQQSVMSTHAFPLASFSYGITIAKDENDNVCLSMRPALFSDLGSAGVAPIAGVLTKTKKGAYTLSEAQRRSREVFQAEATDALLAPTLQKLGGASTAWGR